MFDEYKVWFIRDASSGLGRHLVQRALEGNNNVIATARVLEQIQDLRTLADPSRLCLLQFDITDPSEVVRKKIDEAFDVWGRIDVLVNDPETGIKMMENTRENETTHSSRGFSLSSVIGSYQSYNIPASSHVLRRSLPSCPWEHPPPPDWVSLPSIY